jgi:hypothetical protein
MTEAQAKRNGRSGIVPDLTGDAVRVRTRIGHA